ncbi:MAG: (d)CMP kinase [Myxococcales bacterium]|nr:(d)CMP kinase [Myxococcales bacterium]
MTDEKSTPSRARRPRPIVAIDGPAGAGKSTVAREVAVALGYVLVDTGALYRAIALGAHLRKTPRDDRHAIESLAEELVASGALEMHARAGQTPTLVLDGVARTDELRTPDISQGASVVSRYPGVRAALLELQRSFGRQGGVVLEGRDIGTVVFPDAEVKFFLTATDERRAHRRHAELVERGTESRFEDVLREVRERDERDAARDIAPMRAAEDAVVLDSSERTIAEVVAVICDAARQCERGV